MLCFTTKPLPESLYSPVESSGVSYIDISWDSSPSPPANLSYDRQLAEPSPDSQIFSHSQRHGNKISSLWPSALFSSNCFPMSLLDSWWHFCTDCSFKLQAPVTGNRAQNFPIRAMLKMKEAENRPFSMPSNIIPTEIFNSHAGTHLLCHIYCDNLSDNKRRAPTLQCEVTELVGGSCYVGWAWLSMRYLWADCSWSRVKSSHLDLRFAQNYLQPKQ